MSIRIRLAVFTILAGSICQISSAMESPSYLPWSALDRSFTCEVPNGWKDMSEGGMLLVGPGLLTSGFSPSLKAIFRKNGDDPEAAANFIARETGSDYNRQVEMSKFLGIAPPSPKPIIPSLAITIDGKKALRFEKKWTWGRVHPIPGVPLEKHPPGKVIVASAYAVIPAVGGYWVLNFDAAERDYKLQLPHFEHLIKTFRFKQNGQPGAAESKPPETIH